MIINNSIKNNVISNSISSKNLKISPDEKDQAFLVDMQISKLYKNKVRAVVQEYISNARDANFESGKFEEPIEIHLPSKDEPFFAVSDSGLGMSPDVIDKYICSTGASTKRDSNVSLGAFGLGAKCAFAIVKEDKTQWSITTASNGIKYFYVCYYDQFGLPTVSLMSEEPTDEIGTTISVPTNDYFKFREEAVDILRFWNGLYPYHLYSSEGNIEPKINDSILYECEDYVIYNQERHQRNTVVSVGGIPYLYSSRFDNHNKFWLLIKMKIGVLDITPSREDLESTKNNEGILKTICDNAYAKLIEIQQAKIDSYPNELSLYVGYCKKEFYIFGDFQFKYKNYDLNTNTFRDINYKTDFHKTYPNAEMKFVFNDTIKTTYNERLNYIEGDYQILFLNLYRERFRREFEFDELCQEILKQFKAVAIEYKTLKAPRTKREKSPEPTFWKLSSQRFVPQFSDISELSGCYFVGANLKPVDENVMKVLTKTDADWSSNFVTESIYMIPKRNLKLAEENENLKELVSFAKKEILSEKNVKRIHRDFASHIFGFSNFRHLCNYHKSAIKDQILLDFMNKCDTNYGSNQFREIYKNLHGAEYQTPEINYLLKKYELCISVKGISEGQMVKVVEYISKTGA